MPTSISGKHFYRFEYLKSEQWSTVRIAALAREKGKCQICGEESISNDAHHIWYPENIYKTTSDHLVILCRSCHDLTHALLPRCKTRDKSFGMQEWTAFKNAINSWRTAKASQLKVTESGLPLLNAHEVHKEVMHVRGKIFERLNSKCKKLGPNSVRQVFEKLIGITSCKR